MLQDRDWTNLELRRNTTCLNLFFLYKMSGGQIGIDVNNYQNFILNFELQGVIVIDTAKTRRQRTSLFVIAIRLWNKLPAEIAD